MQMIIENVTEFYKRFFKKTVFDISRADCYFIHCVSYLLFSFPIWCLQDVEICCFGS